MSVGNYDIIDKYRNHFFYWFKIKIEPDIDLNKK